MTATEVSYLSTAQLVELIPGAQQLLVRQMTWESDGVLSISLTHPNGEALPEWSLGAHIDVIVGPNLIRQYSLCSSPEVRHTWTIAVLREPESSGGSRYIHDVLRPGMLVAVAGPRNNFPLVSAGRYLFIAGGIGITPLLPMVVALDRANTNWSMLYGGRRRASMAFLDQLGALGNRVQVCPEDEFGLLNLCDAIGETEPDTAIYCCGPEALISAVEEQCLTSGGAELHVERFNARPDHELESDTDNLEFELVLARSGRQFTIPRDKSIIEVLSENHVFVPTSCTEGYCGVCETEVISGIPNHRDDYLSPEKRATNSTMMICVGRSKTPQLVIKM